MSFSQTIYPKSIVHNNDTLILISTIQLKEVNKLFIKHDYLQKYNLELNEQLNVLTKISNNKDEILIIKDNHLKLLTEENYNLTQLNQHNENLYKESQKTIKFLKCSLVGVVVIGVLGIIVSG